MDKFKISYLLIIFLFNHVFSKNHTENQIWIGAQTNKLFKKIRFEISGENRYNINDNILHKSHVEILLTYKHNNMFKFSTGYRYINYDDKFKSRISIDNKSSISLYDYKLGLRMKLQRNYLNNEESEEIIFRHKFSVNRDISPSISPYLSIESFYIVSSNTFSFEKYRASSGMRFKINNQSTLKLFYCYTIRNNSNNYDITNTSGINYEYSF